MKTTIPFTKDILFKSKIAAITSISLEHELDINEDSITGNFIISGDYKTHEISVNKEEFTYKLPFSVEITENIDEDTINFDITDFNYEIIDNDTLRINIEFNVEAQEKEIEEEPELREEEIFEQPEEEIENTSIADVEIPIVIEETKENVEVEEPIEIDDVEERVAPEEQETILNTINQEDDEFMMYNIHIVRQNETIESISQSYNTTVEIIKEYNSIEEINIGDKILIPQSEDE